MSTLEELIATYCPNGVEYKKIKDVYKRLKGTPITAGKMKEIEDPDGEIRIFAGGKTAINAKEEDIPNANITRVPAVLVQSRGVIDFIFYDKPFTFKNEMWAYTTDDKDAVKFLYYVLKNNTEHFRKTASGMGSLPQISLSVTEDFVVPVPPLAVQREIVRVLDNFTNLTANLTAELTARKKQYEYYRDQLLNVGKAVKFTEVSLGDIISVERGVRLVRKQLSEDGKHPVYQNSLTPLGYYTESNRKGGQTYVIGAGAAGDIGYSDVDFWAADDCYTFVCPQTVNNRFLYYCLLNQQPLIYSKVRRSSIPRLSRDELLKLKLSIPPLSVQERVVSVLDNFDAVCSDLNIGLPAEIEARRKQYEYYRDLLLSFNTSPSTDIERERVGARRSDEIKLLQYVFGYANVRLSELFETRNGYTPSKNNPAYWEGNTCVPWFRMEDIRKNGRILHDAIQHVTPEAVKGSLFPANSFIVATCATIGEHALITVPSLANQQFTYLMCRPDYAALIDMKYMFYYCFKLDEYCKNHLNQGNFVSVDMSKFREFVFSLPPIDKQREIADILDRFDALCNDITKGLPAEIEARKKQYEYYRDKLLTFKEA